MTQEFVSETIGVSRRAVSKWENGTSDPNTSNLIALAKLYGISAEELLKNVEHSAGTAKPNESSGKPRKRKTGHAPLFCHVLLPWQHSKCRKLAILKPSDMIKY